MPSLPFRGYDAIVPCYARQQHWRRVGSIPMQTAGQIFPASFGRKCARDYNRPVHDES